MIFSNYTQVFALICGILIGLVVLVVILPAMRKAKYRRKYRKMLHTDLISGTEERKLSKRICLLNIFWDLGADYTAFVAINDLGLVNEDWSDFSPNAKVILLRFLNKYQ